MMICSLRRGTIPGVSLHGGNGQIIGIAMTRRQDGRLSLMCSGFVMEGDAGKKRGLAGLVYKLLSKQGSKNNRTAMVFTVGLDDREE